MSNASIMNETPKTGHREPAFACDAQEFTRVVESRRAVRVFTTEAVPESVMREILRISTLAPSSSNLQMWEFHWVRNPEKKRRLVDACLSQTAARTAPELVVCVARLRTWPQVAERILKDFDEQEKNNSQKVPQSAKNYYKKLIPFVLRQGPFGVLGLAKRILFMARGIRVPTPRSPVSCADMRVWAHKSCALACQNLMLAARAHGFDTCPLEGFDSARVHRILELPGDAEIVMVLPVGKRAPEGVYGPRMRLPFADVVKVHY